MQRQILVCLEARDHVCHTCLCLFMVRTRAFSGITVWDVCTLTPFAHRRTGSWVISLVVFICINSFMILLVIASPLIIVIYSLQTCLLFIHALLLINVLSRYWLGYAFYTIGTGTQKVLWTAILHVENKIRTCQFFKSSDITDGVSCFHSNSQNLYVSAA